MRFILIRATFVWNNDDNEFVSELLAELRQLGDAADDPCGAYNTPEKTYHRILIQAMPAHVDECLALLAGVAEAGARLDMELIPK